MLALPPLHTGWVAMGCAVIDGMEFTLSTDVDDVAGLHGLVPVITTEYVPESDIETALNVKSGVAAPEIFPPSTSMSDPLYH
jgi:hypothetical protein